MISVRRAESEILEQMHCKRMRMKTNANQTADARPGGESEARAFLLWAAKFDQTGEGLLW